MSYTFPAFDGKHAEPALIDRTPALEQSDVSPDDAPEAVIITYQTTLFDHVREEHATEELFADRSLFDCYLLEDERIGVVGDFGIGAPMTAMIVELLAAHGVEAFVSAGFAGCLQTDIGMSDVIVPDSAIRDEGTSHHYLAPAERVEPTPSLATDIRAAAEASERTVHDGPTWTTDAIYRETIPEIEHYAAEGVLTVEMEAAAVFAVARHRGFEAAAALVVSDYLGTEEWDPQFEDTEPHLVELFEISVAALQRHLDERA